MVNFIYRHVNPLFTKKFASQGERDAHRGLAPRAGSGDPSPDHQELNTEGFKELRVPHMAVLQFPGPDGVRPGTLAERAGMSKQAMNQLLRSLEGLGYITRSNSAEEGRARIIRFTKRGRAAYAKVHDILGEIEREWSSELGPKDFVQLKDLLFRVWESPLSR
jgi:DNA-binding MarR family transcriptional regulator